MSTTSVDLQYAVEETKLALAALRVAGDLQAQSKNAATHENLLGCLAAVERAASTVREVIAAHGFSYKPKVGGAS